MLFLTCSRKNFFLALFNCIFAGLTLSWWSWSGLNRRPPACKDDALPAELQPLVGLDRLELSTSRLSGVRSNHLSYRPIGPRLIESEQRRDFSLKEVIQPQVPLRLPCYDFTPIISPTVDGCLPSRGLAHRLRVKPTFVV